MEVVNVFMNVIFQTIKIVMIQLKDEKIIDVKVNLNIYLIDIEIKNLKD